MAWIKTGALVEQNWWPILSATIKWQRRSRRCNSNAVEEHREEGGEPAEQEGDREEREGSGNKSYRALLQWMIAQSWWSRRRAFARSKWSKSKRRRGRGYVVTRGVAQTSSSTSISRSSWTIKGNPHSRSTGWLPIYFDLNFFFLILLVNVIRFVWESLTSSNSHVLYNCNCILLTLEKLMYKKRKTWGKLWLIASRCMFDQVLFEIDVLVSEKISF